MADNGRQAIRISGEKQHHRAGLNDNFVFVRLNADIKKPALIASANGGRDFFCRPERVTGTAEIIDMRHNFLLLLIFE
jgi:hypothetical protein